MSLKKNNENLRLGVGIIVINKEGKLWLGKLAKYPQWQFPQGGIEANETPEQAMYRELEEETGIKPHQIKIIAESKKWLTYKFPFHFNDYTGAKQKWFIVQLIDENAEIDYSFAKEFVAHSWVTYWYPIRNPVYFKEEVYRKVLKEFARFVFKRKPRF
ncbi:RNA pyrophosphohydrolase [Psittacicella gerlachiana]|uniref:RNA pyrophosphohydrolase n=1 Tax=Psittacicella gerlachiana TaxID=2028574 RepID=A0A3A1Y2G6_9GAMM|nr:RNA pyrophosphohydrolase [Psittacicella gerlachiana]RIY32512.1 RNA pyrophosphohydrolase [Psittacicella gerlachiana]